MDNRRPLNLASTSPATPGPNSPSHLPFRYVHFSEEMDEKATLSDDLSFESKSQSTLAGPSARLQQPISPFPRGPSSHPAPLPLPRIPSQSQGYTRPRTLRISNLIRPWLPVIFYAFTSLGFLVAIVFYKAQLFAALDELSRWLQADRTYGQAVLFFLIFLTTFPPIPLYSTLITLSGYTFGAWTGAVISYFAALSGALVVFLLSRTLLRETISRWLSSACTLKRVVRAIEKRPKLLFLIRLAPYPYNVMNCLLAASPTLTLRTYTICTALSLFKVIIHSQSRDYHMVPEGKATPEESHADAVARMWTIFGITLCVAIFLYIAYVARRAIDEELEGDECVLRRSQDGDEDETVSFLSPRGTGDLEFGCDHSAESQQIMTESPLSPRPSMTLEIDSRVR
ncbi:hypothetical protein BT96DRAFT_961753 [Gymnopus androsaceus JB14]|uniref:Golgi apparatus membrane protein TVP38 n=1 Tax=Gymnopus androsaceus JB14 TaxID=1447944 RepID=A0A6A4IML4_9AGAR|nr:hypothetical protein BT96DRAFT_961753 [Gymnopus androsaceus JB14]